MARQLLLQHGVSSMSQVGLAVGLLCLCAFALFMCASHSRRWRKWRACYGYGGNDPVIQLNQEGIHEYQFGDTDTSTCSGEASIWKKNILMGGKCQLPDFSGIIIYDSAGNIATPAKIPRALPWK